MQSQLKLDRGTKSFAAFSYAHFLVAIFALIFKRDSGFVRHHAIVSLIISAFAWLLPLALYQYIPYSILPYVTYIFWGIRIIGFLIAITGYTWPLIPIRPSETDYNPTAMAGTAVGDAEKKLRSYAVSNNVLIVVALLAFSPLFFGFLLGFLTQGKETGLISAILFIAFIIALVFKLLVQSYLFRNISHLISNTEIQNSPQLTEAFAKLGKSYGFIVGKTVILLSGLIPVLQLASIWIAIPVGALLITEYAERKFFSDINQYLKTRSNQPTNLSLDLLYVTLVPFYISIPLVAVALWYGLQSLNF